MDRRGIEPRSPACKTSVLPFDEQPIVIVTSSASGSRTHTHEVLSFAALPVCIQRHKSLSSS